MAHVRAGLAQLNLVVGDLDGNTERIIEAMKSADSDHCDLVAFPELAITGYPPEDLLLKPAFVSDNREALARVVAASGRCAALVGFVDQVRDQLYNAVAVCADGRLVGTYHKQQLPNYEVFDERRYFEPGSGPVELYRIGGVRVAATICEDAWVADGPLAAAGRAGAELIVNVNGSPFHAGKQRERERILADRAAEAGCPIVYVNLVGGQDELVFDGGSQVIDAGGRVVSRVERFGDVVFVTDVEVPERPEPPDAAPVVELSATSAAGADIVAGAPPLDEEREVYEALVLGTRDYVQKNGFGDVVVGLSGGVDSSLVATVAVDALGPERVHGVLMPSRYSSDGSITDAELLADNLGIDARVIAIEPAHQAFTAMLAESFAGRAPDLTEENLQSRIRGVTLMALSNKLGWLVLTTGNKSESAVGYSTLYGDTAGGFAVIKDVPKLLVYRLCRSRNDRAGRELIPESVLEKPPSAELRPDQRDDESLPPYEQLDPIIEAYVEDDRTATELVEMGFDPAVVERIVRLIDLAEYKRRQSPPGVRITTKAFGKDRRLPITNRYRGDVLGRPRAGGGHVAQDRQGLSLTGGADGIEAYERAVDHLLRFQAEVVDEIRASLAADPSFAMGNVLSVYLSLMSTDGGDVVRARQTLDGLAPDGVVDRLQPREQAHLQAASRRAAGDLAGAGRLLDEIAIEHPTDVVALAVGHQIDFFTGDAVNLRDRVGRALASWDPAEPRFGFLLGMHAFGLEECNLYGPSEDAGLRVLDAHADDVWAVHAVVHTHEMQGAVPEGLQFMHARRADWASGNFLNVHNSWHYALFLLEADDPAAALEVYDHSVRNADSSDVALELLDATALLWRLHLDGVGVGDRWSPLADGWAQTLESGFYPFNDMHAAMAFVGSGRLDEARALVRTLTEVVERGDQGSTGWTMTASVGLPICRAVLRFGEDDHQAVVDELWPIRRRVHTFGGSHAQRDAVERTLLESALRAGRLDMASALLSERLALRDRSTYGWAKLAQLRSERGDGPGAAAAAHQASELAAAAKASI